MIGSYPRTQKVREARRARAEAVLARSTHLTLEEKLEKLDDGNFIAARERFRIARKIKQAEEEAAKKTKKK